MVHKTIRAVAPALLVLGLLGGCEPDAVAETEAGANATTPYPPGADTPTFWSAAQWAEHRVDAARHAKR